MGDLLLGPRAYLWGLRFRVTIIIIILIKIMILIKGTIRRVRIKVLDGFSIRGIISLPLRVASSCYKGAIRVTSRAVVRLTIRILRGWLASLPSSPLDLPR